MHKTETIINATLANARLMIRDNIAENDQWLTRGILAIYERQTADEQTQEQTQEQTRYSNGIGFGATDAEILSSFAKQLLKGWTLSAKQMQVARRCMAKYSGQLARIVREKHTPVNA